MKITSRTTILIGLIGVGSCAVAQKDDSEHVELKNKKDSLSYVIGTDVGEQLKDLNADIEMEPFEEGFTDALEAQGMRIDSVRAEEIRKQFAESIRDELEKEQEAIAREGMKESKEYLAENKKRKGVKTTASGLQYEVLQKGNGEKPDKNDTVAVTYTGMLTDSTVFDQSPPDETSIFPLDRIITGLREGVLMMREGAKYRFYVPPQLAYGEEGAPPIIPPNAVLIFELELVETDVPPEKVSKR